LGYSADRMARALPGTDLGSAEPAYPRDGSATQGSPATHRLRTFRDLGQGMPTWIPVLAFYIAFALLTIGRYAVFHPTTICACLGNEDPATYMWSMAWWPHAIGHGLNPFVTHYLWAPTGVDIAKGATIPAAAILMTPVTAVFGPVLSYNIVSLASPALSAFTAYLLCRRLVRRELPAVAGGFLFGFSSYEIAQSLGHLNLVTIFLIPVMVHIALRRLDREISRRVYVLSMAALLALQLGLSTELLAESVLLGAVLLVCARFIAPEPQRRQIVGLALETVFAGLLTIILTAPFLYYALFSGGFPPAEPRYADLYPLDLANPLFPTAVTWLGHKELLPLSATFTGGNFVEADGYLGLAIMAAFATWFFSGAWRTVLGKLLAIVIALSVAISLGAHLHLAGIETAELPFNWVKGWPIFDKLVPSRTIVFATLAVAIGVASWLAKEGGHYRGRWLLFFVGALMLFPNVQRSYYGGTPRIPAFFKTDVYRRYIAQGQTVLVLPFGRNDVSMLWQATTDFYFYMPEGYVANEVPPALAPKPGVMSLWNNSPLSLSRNELHTFLIAHRVSRVIVDPPLAESWPTVLAQLGLYGHQVGGILIYEVPHALSWHPTPVHT
jgi:hypothetical protein